MSYYFEQWRAMIIFLGFFRSLAESRFVGDGVPHSLFDVAVAVGEEKLL